MSASDEIAVKAAALVVDEGMEYGAAKRRAARNVGGRTEWPSNEQIEDAVREHIEIYCADTQPAELRALRSAALVWMQRLAAFRPHLSGATWRGTATRLSSVHIDLYCDDTKAAAIEVINGGVDHDVASLDQPGREPLTVLTLSQPCAALGEHVTVHLLLHDADDLRGALKPDGRGRTWRGDEAAVRRLLEPGA